MGQPTPGVPFYKVQTLDGRKSRTLHRSLLLSLKRRLRQQGDMEREATSESDMEEDRNSEVSGMPISPHVRPKRGGPSLKPQVTQQKKGSYESNLC